MPGSFSRIILIFHHNKRKSLEAFQWNYWKRRIQEAAILYLQVCYLVILQRGIYRKMAGDCQNQMLFMKNAAVKNIRIQGSVVKNQVYRTLLQKLSQLSCALFN